MRQKLLYSIFGVVLLGMTAAPAAPEATRTPAISSQPDTLARPVLRLSGATFAKHSADLRAPRLGGQRSRGSPGDWGLVLVYLSPAGTAVKKGEAVARFDPLYMENRLDDMRALRIERETAVEVLRANLEVERAARAQRLARAKAKMEKAALDLQTAPIRSEIQTEILRTQS